MFLDHKYKQFLGYELQVHLLIGHSKTNCKFHNKIGMQSSVPNQNMKIWRQHHFSDLA